MLRIVVNAFAALTVILWLNEVHCSGELDSNRVVNGTDAENGEYPFIASLRLIGNEGFASHMCGCSIIDSEWLLTAAHCVLGIDPSSWNVQYGITDITPNGPTIAAIKNLIVHEGYDPSDNYVNDIALIQLSNPLRLNDLTNTVKLPRQNQTTEGGSNATLIGWGLNATDGTIQKHLQKVNLTIFSDSECRKLHDNRTHITNICAGVPGGGKGQCSGDSGGPLIVDGTQVGIVSWSMKPCTVAPYPGVYTKVSSYIDWVRRISGLREDD